MGAVSAAKNRAGSHNWRGDPFLLKTYNFDKTRVGEAVKMQRIEAARFLPHLLHPGSFKKQ